MCINKIAHLRTKLSLNHVYRKNYTSESIRPIHLEFTTGIQRHSIIVNSKKHFSYNYMVSFTYMVTVVEWYTNGRSGKLSHSTDGWYMYIHVC